MLSILWNYVCQSDLQSVNIIIMICYTFKLHTLFMGLLRDNINYFIVPYYSISPLIMNILYVISTYFNKYIKFKFVR